MAPRLSRRGLLKAAGLATAAAPLSAACSSNDNTVEVFVNWSGGEYDSFRSVADRFEDYYRKKYRVVVVSVGEQMRELLRARFNANNPPDVAVTSLPGLVMEYARSGRVRKLDLTTMPNIPESLNDTVKIGNDLFGLWVKAAHKSIFWYRQSALDEVGVKEFPNDWQGFVNLLRAGAGAGKPMLSIGAADGWVLTDWFENVLAATDRQSYVQLASGNVDWWGRWAVRDTLDSLAEVWTIKGVFPHGPQRALLTQYQESVYEVFAERRCAIVFEGDFVGEVIAGLEAAGQLRERADFHRFPTVNVEPLVVGGDVAALLNPSPGGKALVEWLSKPDSMDTWVAKGGFLSPNRDVELGKYPGDLAQKLAKQFQDAGRPPDPQQRQDPGQPQVPEEPPLFDLSDQLGGRLSSGQGRGLQRILTEFFREVTQPEASTGNAIDRAQKRLLAAARGVEEE